MATSDKQNSGIDVNGSRASNRIVANGGEDRGTDEVRGTGASGSGAAPVGSLPAQPARSERAADSVILPPEAADAGSREGYLRASSADVVDAPDADDSEDNRPANQMDSQNYRCTILGFMILVILVQCGGLRYCILVRGSASDVGEVDGHSSFLEYVAEGCPSDSRVLVRLR